MFSPEFLTYHDNAQNDASQRQHRYFTLEHLLIQMLNDADIQWILTQFELDTTAITEALNNYLDEHIPVRDAVPTPTKSLRRVMQRAIRQVQASQSDRLVVASDVLVAIFKESDCFANELLQSMGMDILTLTRLISDLARKRMSQDDEMEMGDKQGKNQKQPLDEYAINLNELVRQGKIDTLIGRDDEIRRVAQILCRRRKNNPLLVGDAGVGKTAIAEGLAWLIVNGKAPDALRNTVVYSLDVGAMVAGTKFRGDFEQRVKDLLNQLKNKPEVLLFIDEIHSIIGAGATTNSQTDISNLIKPALAKGELRCMGSTTVIEFRQLFEKDQALSRRFQKVEIGEPSVDEAIEILHGLKSFYEQFHQVSYTDEAIESAVRLSKRHIHERFLPDKAIDVIDEAGASARLDRTDEQEITLIDVAQIEKIIAKTARIPDNTVSSDDKDLLKNLNFNLKQVIFGQDEAIDVLTDTVLLSRAGLGGATKPIGSFLFTGPTGVGKTEISKQLARALGVELVRFDMSEYMEAHTASRLIGAPPGYVGYDQGGLLTEKIHQYPHCVLLLDELEKAHPDVFNLLLQVMDNGMLTDNNGRSVSFRQVILIMTSNVGADKISRQSMGFTEQDHHHDNSEAIKRHFTPEFRNRLDAIVNFAPLSPSVMDLVVDKFIGELQQVLLEKNVVLTITQSARELLAKQGYDRLMGARPMARLVQEKLKKPLSKMMLFGELSDGGAVLADCIDEQIVLMVK